MMASFLLPPRVGGSFAVVLTGAALLIGCPGSIEDPAEFLERHEESIAGSTGGSGGDPADSTCPDIPALFVPSCAASVCHSTRSAAGGLDLELPKVEERLVGQPAKGCSGTLADPSSPETSILYRKLLDAPPCGSRMPLGGDPIDAATLECIRQWIEAL